MALIGGMAERVFNPRYTALDTMYGASHRPN